MHLDKLFERLQGDGKTLLRCAASLVIGWMCTAVCQAEVVVVRAGRPAATIVVGREASPQVKTAAETLARYVFESSGAQLPVVADDRLPQGQACGWIHVGANRLAVTQNLVPKDLDGDGFVILATGQDVAIGSPSDDGTEFGVYEFLERYVGVRWLLPGENGTDVPERKTIAVPEGRVQEHPVFFPVLQDGQGRYVPKDDEDHGWQPCLAAPGIVDEAVRNIVQFFRDHPQETSYSLGMNDSGNFCRCAECLARIFGEKNYLGWVDYSDLYYDWCSRVIDGVLKEHPDKWFGCLAYFNVATPPARGAVHPRLVPYITYERMKWIDPELRAQGEAATQHWQNRVPAFAWYDYIYGTPYCLPRVYFHHAGEYLRFAAEHGVKAHYAESYPNFGEGPKPYLQLRLWWNPRQDVDQLLSEWYQRCVGPEAAPHLAAYYAIWERFWTQDVRQSAWFNKTGTWLAFNSPGYLADVRIEDLTASRRLLEACIERCQTERQRARARLLERAF